MSASAQTQERPVGSGARRFGERRNLAVSAILVFLPASLFYSILLGKAIDLPAFDDYGLLSFLNQEIKLKGFSARFLCFLASQQNEYKLYFARGIVWIQYLLCGHVSFKILAAIGNGFVLLLGFLLWKMFLPAHKNVATRLAFFIPVSWLLFQLQYWETVDSPLGALQNLPVIVFSFAAIYFLVRANNRRFGFSVASLVLAIAASGNGFLVIPVGVLVLFLERRYGRILMWLSVSAVCILAYAYRYNLMSSQADAHRSVFSVLLRLNPAYAIAFIGSAGSIPIRAGAVVLGLVLCGFLVFMGCRGYSKKNPVVSYCILFLLLTAIGVAGIRSELGVMQSMQSRYTIYSALFLIFAWFAIVEEYLQFRPGLLVNSGAYLGIVLASVSFSLCTDAVGLLAIDARSHATISAMIEFEHSFSLGNEVGPIPQFSSPEGRAKSDALNKAIRPILVESIRLGVHRPPEY